VVTSRHAFTALALTTALAGTGCKPELEGRASLVRSDRVLAVQSSPAEVTLTGASSPAVRYTALYVGAGAVPDPAGLSFAFCTARKPLAVNSPVAPECLSPSGPGLEPIGSGASLQGAVPSDGCRMFGPSPSDPKPGEPPSRPADPDTTGGYYQPVRVLFPGEDGEPGYAVGVTRLDCGLGGATQEQILDFNNRYRPNENPAVDTFVLRRSDGHDEPFAEGADARLPVAPGERVTLQVSWAKCPVVAVCGDGICGIGEAATCTASSTGCTACPADCAPPEGCDAAAGGSSTGTMGAPASSAADCTLPHGCTGSEPYVSLDPAARAIVDRREAIRVSWFATDGEFEHDRTGRTEEEADDASSENAWTAPAAIGDVHVWVVVRDDRGGVGFREATIDVQP